MATVAAALPVVFAIQILVSMQAPGAWVHPFTDANTYLAAGERLNAGHDLYRLMPGDRTVDEVPGYVSSPPLLSPPLVAVVWRPIAAAPIGIVMWLAATWLALLATVVWLVHRIGLPAFLFALALSPAIAQQLAVGNVAAFFPAMLVAAWLLRNRWSAGALVALMAALKIAPGTLGGWVLGTRNWRGMASMAAATMAALGICVAGAGIESLTQYVRVAGSTGPSIASLSVISGLPWLSQTVLVMAAVAAAMLGRWPRLSFAVAIFGSVLGTPALYLAGLVPLLAILAPFADELDGIGHAAPSLPVGDRAALWRR